MSSRMNASYITTILENILTTCGSFVIKWYLQKFKNCSFIKITRTNQRFETSDINTLNRLVKPTNLNTIFTSGGLLGIKEAKESNNQMISVLYKVVNKIVQEVTAEYINRLYCSK